MSNLLRQLDTGEVRKEVSSMRLNNEEGGNHKSGCIKKLKNGKRKIDAKKEAYMLRKIFILGFFVLLTSVYGQVMLNYQGYLTDAQENPINDNVDIIFTIFDEATAGKELWSETQTDVPVERGIFHVFLGCVKEIPNNVFTQDTNPWLELIVNGDTLETRSLMDPPPPVYPPYPPYPDNDWIIVGNNMYSGVPGNVGIGTTSPDYKLDVDGRARLDSSIIFKFDYDSKWQSIAAGTEDTLIHGLGGEEGKYIVFLYGKNDHGIHQMNYGTAEQSQLWFGCAWYKLNNNRIVVRRAAFDGGVLVPESKQWLEYRVRILKNQ